MSHRATHILAAAAGEGPRSSVALPEAGDQGGATAARSRLRHRARPGGAGPGAAGAGRAMGLTATLAAGRLASAPSPRPPLLSLGDVVHYALERDCVGKYVGRFCGGDNVGTAYVSDFPH